MTRSFWLAGMLAILCAVGIGYYTFNHPVVPATNLGAEVFPSMQPSVNAPAASMLALLPPRSAPAGQTEYRNTLYRFSLLYTNDLTQTAHDEGGGAATIVFQNPAEAHGFQIFIVPYVGEQITRQQFLKDEPSGVRNSVSSVTIGGIAAVSFYGQDTMLGETAEIWFIQGGHLFEVTAPKSEAAWLSQIMTTWQFI